MKRGRKGKINKEEAREDDGGVGVVTVQFSEHAKTPPYV